MIWEANRQNLKKIPGTNSKTALFHGQTSRLTGVEKLRNLKNANNSIALNNVGHKCEVNAALKDILSSLKTSLVWVGSPDSAD